jgi:uncharacterized protein (DUF4415 family)
MSEKNIVRRSSANRQNRSRDWSRFDAQTDEEIATAVQNDPDAAPLTDHAFWQDAELILPTTKERITIRLDRDVVDYFRREGRYQTRINAVLRAYMERKRA